MSAIPTAIPASVRTPLFFASVDNSQANTNQQTQRALLIGQVTSAGAAPVNEPLQCLGSADAIKQCGAGSILAMMATAYQNSDSFGEVWYLPIEDATGATAASGTITIAGAPTAAGTISLYVAGTTDTNSWLSIAVGTSDTPTTIAANIAEAINANGNLPVTATSAAGVVTVTAKNKGISGNDIDLRVNYGGTVAGQSTPAGITVTIVALSGGAVNPSLTTALANLGDELFDFIAVGLNDVASLTAVQQLLNDTSGRWSWETQEYGHAFTAYRGTVSAQTTFGTAQNNQHTTILGFNDSPSPFWVWAADSCGAAAVSLRADPGVPLQTLALSTVLAPPLSSRFNLTERNTLLYDGISTFTVGTDGTVALENMITTYQTNAYGQADDSYLEVETMFQIVFLLRALKSVITSKYARMKLVADGTKIPPGATNICSPSTIKADLIANYNSLCAQGYAQGASQFASQIVVQQNTTNPNRVDVLYPPVLMDQLRVFALLFQFRNIVTSTTT